MSQDPTFTSLTAPLISILRTTTPSGLTLSTTSSPSDKQPLPTTSEPFKIVYGTLKDKYDPTKGFAVVENPDVATPESEEVGSNGVVAFVIVKGEAAGEVIQEGDVDFVVEWAVLEDDE